MNCKIGDLAFVTVGPNRDKLVEVIAADIKPNYWIVNSLCGPCAGRYRNTGKTGVALRGAAADAWLRPLRDNPGADETLSWAPVPQKVAA